MRIISVTSQKGGSGKTTIAGHMAVAALQDAGGPIGLIDLDPQGSLADWHEAREDKDNLHLINTGISGLPAAVDELKKKGARFIFIDTPPAITRVIEKAIQLSDIVVIPSRPSPHDLRALGATVDLVEFAGKSMIFAINGATARAKMTGEAAIALSQHGTVAPVVLHNRQEFASSMIGGQTVLETAPQGKSAQEVNRLWSYVAERLKRMPITAHFNVSSRPERIGFGKRSDIAAAPALHA